MSGRLIVNLGSRGVAWRGLDETGGALHEGKPGACLVRAFADKEPPSEVVVGSVARAAVLDELRAACREHWQIEVRALETTAAACGVRNAYAEPSHLGIDRWAALIAAWEQHGGGVLIADCGTAVTVDYLAADGRHVGGLIAPGLGLMRRALSEGTRLAAVSPHAPTPPLLGADTELCVTGGTLAAVAGLLVYAAEKTAARYGRQRALLLTGGYADAVAPRLGTAWTKAPDLVLDGLERLAGEAS